METKNFINIESTRLWTDGKGILYCKFSNDNPNYQLDIARVKLYIKTITEICNGKAMPFLIDLRGARGTFSPSAASFLAQSPLLKTLRISEAFILDSIGTKLLIASYKRIYDPITPYHVFSDVESAEQYCIATKNEFYGSN